MLINGLLVAVCSSSMWLGVLPPRVVQAERRLACLAQARAPERIRIRVVRVSRKVTWCAGPGSYRGRAWRSADLTVDAVVLKVRRTKSGLRRGRKIRFAYRVQRVCPRMPGPSNRPQPLVISKGDVVWAFLRHGSGNHYAPAARFFSFTRTLPAKGPASQWTRRCNRKYPR